jgi:hypothetical protein
MQQAKDLHQTQPIEQNNQQGDGSWLGSSPHIPVLLPNWKLPFGALPAPELKQPLELVQWTS